MGIPRKVRIAMLIESLERIDKLLATTHNTRDNRLLNQQFDETVEELVKLKKEAK